ncbi:ParA family protein [Deinococcus pimensis]|uniref:ParA family protein n=1 Tax=Deinococcus pimensis TaxID=309888 RepID=UPI00047F3023|nr:ParA family protein [Deinococcus pimensis]
MIITVAGYKGGVGKTTTALHLAAYLNAQGPTLLVDGDLNRSATLWSRNGGERLPFKVIPEQQLARHARSFEHIVIDTAARPSSDELRDLASGCDLLVLPTNPEAMSLDAMLQTTKGLRSIGADGNAYRVLLTLVPPKPATDGAAARALLQEVDLPLFEAEVRRTSAFTNASAAGVLVRDVRSRSGKLGWLDYQRVGDELVRAVRA